MKSRRSRGSREERTHHKAEVGKGPSRAPGPELVGEPGLRASGGREGGDSTCREGQSVAKGPCTGAAGKEKS